MHVDSDGNGSVAASETARRDEHVVNRRHAEPPSSSGIGAAK